MSAHIVLIDQEPAMQMVVTAMLQPHQYRVTAVDAIPLPADTDVLLITRPPAEIDDLLPHYLSESHQTIALVSDHQSGSHALIAGADDYLLSPCNKVELLARIQTQLRLKKAAAKIQMLQAELGRYKHKQADANQDYLSLASAEKQQRTLAETLSQIITLINKSLSNEDALGQILEHLTRVLPYDNASIMLLQNDTLHSVAQRSIHPGGYTGTKIPLNRFAHVQEVIQKGIPVIIGDTTADPRWQQLPKTSHIRCWMGVPLTIQGQVIGMLNLSDDEPHQYGEAEARIAAVFSRQAAIAIKNNQLHARLQNIALDLEHQVLGRTGELTEAYDRLQELGLIRAKFLQDVTQELRGPISNLALYLDLWERGQEDKQAQYLEVLKQQAQRLVTLMEGLIRLSQLDLMRSPLNFTPVDINSIVVAAVNSQQQRAFALGLELISEMQPHLPPIRGDWRLLVEMVTHLLENGIRYTNQGIVHILTRHLPESQQVEIQVQDMGTGIAPLDMPHIFEPFFEGSQGRLAGKLGIGLGLTMAKAIVELHHGEIELKSADGKGVTALVRLPAV